MIETRLLTYFLAVAREKNITKAAESLHITQPTLSQQIMSLEKQLGKKLFIRGKKAMTLTVDGVYFQKQAMNILEQLDHMERCIGSGENVNSGVVHIGCSETALPEFVIRAMQDMRKAYPGVQIHIHSENADSLTELLDAHQLDIAMRFSSFKVPGYDNYIMPHWSRWGILLPGNNLLARKSSLSAKDVMALPLIFPKKILTTPQQPSYFPFEIGELTIPIVCNHYNEAIRLTQEGFGFAYILEHAFSYERYPDLVFRPIEPNISTPFQLIAKKEPVLAPAPRYLKNLLQEELQQMAI